MRALTKPLLYILVSFLTLTMACQDQPADAVTNLIPVTIKAALGQNDGLKVFGDTFDTPDGTGIRDYIHVVDLVEAHDLALKYLFDGKESDIFNLGYGHGFSVKEIIDGHAATFFRCSDDDDGR